MSQPAVSITELDGALGVLPPSAGKIYALAGVSSSGTLNAPAVYARISDIVAAFGVGPLVEAAAHFIELYGKPVVIVRTGQTTAGSADAVVFTGSGTSVVTEDGSTDPSDDYEVYFRVVAGGTIGVTGITLQYSLDNGRTFSPVTALGTANTFTVPSSNVKVDFAAGTLVAADFFTFRTHAPKWNTTEIGTALDALKNTVLSWDIVHVVGDIAGADFDAIETKILAMAASGRYRSWIGNFRMPTLAESEASYKTAFDTAFSARATTHGNICAGAVKMVSSVGGRQYRRPFSFIVAAREASVSEETNIADINLGALRCSIRDANGNPDEHDESVNPGLDDSRATVARTFDGIQGVYVNRSRILSADGSDFRLFAHRRVMNLANEALRIYFLRRLNKPVLVNKTTGFILESEAQEIETGALQVMRAALLTKPKASDAQFALSRTDNLLSTQTLTGDARVVPLGYPEFITLTLGFLNPALQVVRAA